MTQQDNLPIDAIKRCPHVVRITVEICERSFVVTMARKIDS
jgi:hypothetical protein